MAGTTEARPACSGSSPTWTPRSHALREPEGQGLPRPHRVHARCPSTRSRTRWSGIGRCRRVRLFTLIGALTGTASGFFLTIWTSLKWELVTGGKAAGVHPALRGHRVRADHPVRGPRHPPRVVVLGRLPQARPVADLRSALHAATASGWPCTVRPSAGGRCRGILSGRGRRGGPAMMKYVFILVLLVVVGGGAGLLGCTSAWSGGLDNMTETPRRSCRASGPSRCRRAACRAGRRALYPKEQRERGGQRRTRWPTSPDRCGKGGELS